MTARDENADLVPRSGSAMVPRSHRGTAEPGQLIAEPSVSAVSTAREGLLTTQEIAELVGVSDRAIRKAIDAGRLVAERVAAADRRRAGQVDYMATPEAVFAAYPQARERWEAQQAAAQAAAAPAPKPLRDPIQVAMRANPEALERAAKIQRARMTLMEQARAFLSTATLSARNRTKGGLPQVTLAQLQAWYVGDDPRAAELRVILGQVCPSHLTWNRWWRDLVQDPSGELLKPRWTSGGRPRKADQDPDFTTKVLGAYGHTGSLQLAAEWLGKDGLDLSPATVGRVLRAQDPAVVKGLRSGDRKAQTDLGPYVRRAASRPFQCWSLDGHTLDDLVLWDTPFPGEKLDPFRPNIYAVRDVGSGALIAAIIGRGLNRYLALTAVASAILHLGVIPQKIQSDNGSEVINGLFQGDEDTEGYFSQLGAEWSEEPIQTRALPYNSRSKPVERSFGTLTKRFSVLFPAYVGSNPSSRPGEPLAEARRAGNYETIATLKVRLAAFLEDELKRDHRIKGRTIVPAHALAEEKANLLQQLGPEHPRFVNPGQEWRVLPSLRGRQVRGAVEARLEGQVLRFDAPLLRADAVDGLQVRVNPWDVTQAWLCRGGELIQPLTFIPDGPALGAGTDLVSLRIAANARRAQLGVSRQAKKETERIRRDAGYLTGNLPAAPPKVVDTFPAGQALTADEMADATAMLAAMNLSPELPSQAPTPAPSVVPSGRPMFSNDMEWAKWLLDHESEADATEWRQLQEFLRDNPAIAVALNASA